MRAGRGHSAQRRLPGIETRNVKRRHCRWGTCGALNTLQVPAVRVPAVCRCLLCECPPSFFILFFILLSFFSVLFAFSLSLLLLPYSYFIFYYFLHLRASKQTNKETNKPNRSAALCRLHTFSQHTFLYTVNRNKLTPQRPSMSAAPADCISVQQPDPTLKRVSKWDDFQISVL